MLSEIERKAWEKRTDADKHSPNMALRATLDQISRGELPNIRHVIVIAVERDAEEGDLVHFIQAGDLSEFATEGVLLRAIRISQENE